MRNLAFVLFFTIIVSQAYSQSKKYFSVGGEMIFSFAAIDHNGQADGNVMRFSPFFCIQPNFNYDFTKNFGSFVGISIRNIGFIYDEYEVPNPENPDETKMLKKKYRTYNIGLPIGIKLGVMDKSFVFGGYEIEYPFHYKEKTFDGDHKDDKFGVWFSDRVESFQHGFFAGMQLPHGLNLKFKYYLSQFHNMDYVDNDGLKPYDGLKTNIFYFAVTFNPFKNMKDSFEESKPKKAVF